MDSSRPVLRMLAAALAIGSILGVAEDARARSNFTANSNVVLTLSSITSFGQLGLNVFVNSVSNVDTNVLTESGSTNASLIPTLTGPSGNWALNDSLHHTAFTDALVGDVVGSVDATLATSGAITLQNFSDAATTFIFDWSLDLSAVVSQDGVSPENDSAFAQASFSLIDDLGAEPVSAGLVVADTLLGTADPPDVRSGTFSYTVQGGQTRVLTVIANVVGTGTATDTSPPDADGDGVEDALDNCPTVPNTNQTDGDGDAVGDACDSCTAVANPRVAGTFLPANPWATLTGDQRDDDHDGYGNRCDAKFPGVAGTLVGAGDLVQFRASIGKNRTLDVCGTTGTRPCAIFDLDETATVLGAGDLAAFRLLNGKVVGPKCAVCPLACEAGTSGTCGPVP